MSIQLNNFRYFFLAHIYDAVLQWFYQPLVQRLVAVVNAQPGESVLEIGVGTGISIPYYAAHKRVTAVDCSLPMLRRARLRAARHPGTHIDLRHATAEEIGPEVARFTQVVFCNSLSVVQQPEQLLAAYYQALRPGGSIHLLNHFTPERGPLRQLDRLLTPAGQLLGFQSFFPLQPFLDPAARVRVTSLRGGYWRIVHIYKPDTLPC